MNRPNPYQRTIGQTVQDIKLALAIVGVIGVIVLIRYLDIPAPESFLFGEQP